MNCLEFRRAFGADPTLASAESLAHRAECPMCEKYAQEMIRLNGLIKRALDVPVPPAREVVVPPRARWYAMAASLLVVIGIAGAVWLLGYPRASLAVEVIAHLSHEPEALTPTGARVAAELLDGALKAKGLHLAGPINDVSYLQSCLLRGHFVPHLVVQTDQGPVTVMLLTEENIKAVERFDEGQYHGLLLPTAKGGLAVVATDANLAEQVAGKIAASIAWN